MFKAKFLILFATLALAATVVLAEQENTEGDLVWTPGKIVVNFIQNVFWGIRAIVFLIPVGIFQLLMGDMGILTYLVYFLDRGIAGVYRFIASFFG